MGEMMATNRPNPLRRNQSRINNIGDQIDQRGLLENEEIHALCHDFGDLEDAAYRFIEDLDEFSQRLANLENDPKACSDSIHGLHSWFIEFRHHMVRSELLISKLQWAIIHRYPEQFPWAFIEAEDEEPSFPGDGYEVFKQRIERTRQILDDGVCDPCDADDIESAETHERARRAELLRRLKHSVINVIRAVAKPEEIPPYERLSTESLLAIDFADQLNIVNRFEAKWRTHTFTVEERIRIEQMAQQLRNYHNQSCSSEPESEQKAAALWQQSVDLAKQILDEEDWGGPIDLRPFVS